MLIHREHLCQSICPCAFPNHRNNRHTLVWHWIDSLWGTIFPIFWGPKIGSSYSYCNMEVNPHVLLGEIWFSAEVERFGAAGHLQGGASVWSIPFPRPFLWDFLNGSFSLDFSDQMDQCGSQVWSHKNDGSQVASARKFNISCSCPATRNNQEHPGIVNPKRIQKASSNSQGSIK